MPETMTSTRPTRIRRSARRPRYGNRNAVSRNEVSASAKLPTVNPRQLELLQRFAVMDADGGCPESELFLYNSIGRRASALWRRGLLAIIDEHPETGWKRYAITEIGRQVLIEHATPTEASAVEEGQAQK